jgi:hypothetical protein
MVASGRSTKRPVTDLRSLGKPGLYVFTCLSCGGADRRQNIGGLTVPMAAASQIVISRWQTTHHTNCTWAYRIPIKNLSLAPGIELVCGPGPIVKRFFTSIEPTF